VGSKCSSERGRSFGGGPMALTLLPAEGRSSGITSSLGEGRTCVPVVHWMRCYGGGGG
jgi:hypothetical protein